MFCGFLKVFIASTALKVWGYTYSLGVSCRLVMNHLIYMYMFSLITTPPLPLKEQNKKKFTQDTLFKSFLNNIKEYRNLSFR